MKNFALGQKYLETLLSAIFSLLLMAGLLALLIMTGFLFSSGSDEGVVSAVQRSDAFATVLKGDDIRIDSREGTVILRGTVAEESHIVQAGRAVAGLPGVLGVENQLRVAGGRAPQTLRSTRSWPQQRR